MKEVFEPVMKNDNNDKLRSYNSTNLFYVAFFGGIIPTIALNYQNAKWLRLNKKIVNYMAILGVAVLVLKAMIVSLKLEGYIFLSDREIRWGYKIITVSIYVIYQKIFENRNRLFQIIGEEKEPILRDAVKWWLIGAFIEFAAMMSGVWIIRYVI